MQLFLRYLSFSLSFLLFYPIAFLIEKFYSNCKFGIIVSSHIGHLFLDTETLLIRLSEASSNRQAIKIFLVTQPFVCNYYVPILISGMNFPNLKIKVFSGRPVYYFCRFLQKTQVFRKITLETYGLVDHWAKTIASPVIFSLPLNDQNIFTSWLKSRTHLNELNPCITLHNRDSAYRPKDLHNSYRDFHPSVFLGVIEKFGDKYNFIRVGRLARDPLRSFSRGCIDLPFSASDDKLDVLCQEASLFYFGSDSGIQCISHAFRKPTAGICYSPFVYGALRKMASTKLGFIPKRIAWRNSGRPIGLIEMYEKKLINFYSSREIEEAGICVIDNSNQEVLEFFEEVLVIHEKNLDKSAIHTEEQEEFWRIVIHYEPDSKCENLILDNCFIGTRFLKRNPYLVAS